MPAENLIRQTVSRFPRYAGSGIEITPVEKGGSDRKYYRVAVAEERSLILVKYGKDRTENSNYVAIARFLSRLGIRVPEIYFHDEDEHLIWMEDLGERDLWSYRNEPWGTLRDRYRSALGELVKLHTRAQSAVTEFAPALETEFDAELYRWEQNYFFENCVHRFFGGKATACDEKMLAEIAARLHEQPRVVVHRDFQSQNILLRDGNAYLIDFQGLRPGLAQYDLASLVYDPYVALTAVQREELITLYVEKALDADGKIAPDFRAIFDLCALQRLMQALGAYGFLGLAKERPQFLDYIPPALASLREVVARIDGLRELPELLDQLRARS
ncbi:MAG: N-acetylmuramate 1-kinase [Chthoniobacter sp.]|nr:N-acetylmuramate 1-kinase [Chthoniobacter sp.]